MDKFEAYSFLLSDSFFGNILLYAHSEFVLYAMKHIGGYDNNIMLIVSLAGFTVSCLFNYFFGVVLYMLYKSTVNSEKQSNYWKFHGFFHKYGHYLLFTNILPLFGSFLPLVAGFASFGAWRSLVISLGSKTIFYIYYIYL
jgi:membrane protein YqaA with SNARE-associated domain